MPTTNYDSSLLTKRRANKASSGSFITRITSPNNTTGYAPQLGIYDNSIINTVKLGSMIEYRKCDGSVLVNPGCPCPQANSPNFTPPGEVSNIRWIIGSIILQWDPPTQGDGPFTYQITPYLNGSALSTVVTTSTEYRFVDLEEWKPYTFSICAINAGGMGALVKTTDSILMPPSDISNIMTGASGNPDNALKYVLNDGINKMLYYITKAGLGPTRGSRIMYLWIMSIVGAWKWVSDSSAINGIHDIWNWNTVSNLSKQDSIVWICSVIDHITPIFVGSTYSSIYNCPINIINRVKSEGNWDNWLSTWQSWYNNRVNDGSSTTGAILPTNSANWNNTIVVDGTTVTDISGFTAPCEWTRLTVQGKKQGYLTWNWESVLSTCLTSEQETEIRGLVEPSTGDARDAEIDDVMSIAATLTDEKKMIAEFWAGGPKTPAPPCMYIWLCKEYLRIQNYSCDKMMYSLLDLCIHLFEGGRVTWMLKKQHMEARPIQEIRRRYTGQDIQSWNGIIKGDQWIPYQEADFVTPPFADFPSGHSHFGRAFALTMNKWFGESISADPIIYDKLFYMGPMFGQNQTNTFGAFTIPQGTSGVEPGSVPSFPITLSWPTWNDMAESSGVSRFY
jgi:hypothetical protein